MSATAVQPLLDLFAAGRPDKSSSGHAGLTLDERIASVWEGLVTTGTTDCPVCRGKLERVGDHGLCTSCGSSLS